MISKKVIISLSAVAVAVIIIAFFIVSYQASPNGKPIWNPIIEYKAILNVNSQVSNSYWTRSPTTDLPDYVNEIVCYVRNTGNTAASNVNLEIKVDGNVLTTRYFPSIPIEAVETYSFSLTMPYDSSRSLFLWASCPDSEDTYSFSVVSEFPSSPYTSGSFSQTIAQLFVTPNEQNVKTMKDSILKNKFLLDADWTALWTWVGSNIKYNAEDSNSYHWQFSKDTLASRYGMCADYSVLLVSMYRDGVFGPDDVFVVGGTNQAGKGHAWVVVRLPIVGWYTLDPQENGGFLVNLLANPFVVSGYTANYEFNDQQFHVLR